MHDTCHLETTNARNLPFYEKHGFRVADEHRMPHEGPSIWGLVAKLDRGPASLAPFS
jgi:hypothetical protein